MYLKFYQLSKKPFSLAPDPEFLYLSQSHKDAMGAIIYGIREKQGFVSVVGEVGTGKTTVTRAYLRKCERGRVLPIFIFNSRVSFSELLETILHEIGISDEVLKRQTNINSMVKLAYKVMLEKSKRGITIVLIIDEAQNMPNETLAKLCILSNFETSKVKLIQIVLIGQPELQKKLNLHELRQLRQRIAYRAHINPLSKEDSTNYIHHRLSLASKSKATIFTKNAIRQIVKYSKGTPRVINILCENSLVAGYGLQNKPISTKIVKQVISEYNGKESPSPSRMKHVLSGALSFAIVALILTITLPALELSGDFDNEKTSDVVFLQSTLEEPKSIIEGSDAAVDTERETDLAAQNDFLDVYERLRSWRSFALFDFPEVKIQNDNKRATEEVSISQQIPIYSHEKADRVPYLKIIQRGDTVSRLCLSAYGFVNTQVLRWIKKHNPHIINLDEISINEIIYFPEMTSLNFKTELTQQSTFKEFVNGEVVTR